MSAPWTHSSAAARITEAAWQATAVSVSRQVNQSTITAMPGGADTACVD